MDCVTHFNGQLETVQESIKWYMYVQHPHSKPMDKVHGINLSTCSDLPLMNIMIICQIDLQWTQFNSNSIYKFISWTCMMSNYNVEM